MMIADLSQPYRRHRQSVDHRLRLAIALAVAVALVILLNGLVHAGLSSGAGDQVTVAPGDTLWTIAAAHTDGDVRQELDAIMAANHLRTPVIVPGQQLEIPAA